MSARLVQEEEPQTPHQGESPVEATPVPVMTKERVMLLAGVVVVLVAAIIATAVVLSAQSGGDTASPQSIVVEDDDDGNGSSISLTPSSDIDLTGAATEYPRLWFETGNIEGGSDDELGAQVTISRNGRAFAASAPGDWEGGDVRVYLYHPAGWDLVTRIPVEWGRSVALADSGTVLAIGRPIVKPPQTPDYDFDETAEPWNTTGLFGSVEVYRISFNRTAARYYRDGYEVNDGSGSFEQIGSTLLSSLAGDPTFGGSLDLSADGSVLIVGSSVDCFFQSYHYDDISNDWLPFGQGIDCTMEQSDEDNYEDVLLSNVGLSDNGLRAAIGKPSRPAESLRGIVEISEFRGSFESDEWQPLGQALVGDENGDAFGASLSLSGDGKVIAVGAPLNNAGRGPISGTDQSHEANIGACFLYKYNETLQEWQQLGSALQGENVGDLFGTSVSMNADGTAVAVGAIRNNDNGDDSGHVRVYKYNPFAMDWVQVGGDIPGIFEYALSGSGIALSATGETVVVGSPNNVAVDTDRQGSVQVFETGIMPESGTVAVSVILEFAYGDDIAWTIERLDVEHDTTVYYASVPEDTYSDDATDDTPFVPTEIITTVLLDEGGAYRFLIVCPGGLYLPWDYYIEYGGYQLVFGDSNAEANNLIAERYGNFSDHSEVSFLVPSSSTPLSQTESRSLTLSISFDEHPEDVHWVIVEEGSSQVDRRVLAFGPETQYGFSLAKTTLEISVSISAVSPSTSEFKLIYSDTARDGLCCNTGSGSFELYDDQEEKVLLSGTAEGKRRAVFPFSLARDDND